MSKEIMWFDTKTGRASLMDDGVVVLANTIDYISLTKEEYENTLWGNESFKYDYETKIAKYNHKEQCWDFDGALHVIPEFDIIEFQTDMIITKMMHIPIDIDSIIRNMKSC